MTVTDEMGNLF